MTIDPSKCRGCGREDSLELVCAYQDRLIGRFEHWRCTECGTMHCPRCGHRVIEGDHGAWSFMFGNAANCTNPACNASYDPCMFHGGNPEQGQAEAEKKLAKKWYGEIKKQLGQDPETAQDAEKMPPADSEKVDKALEKSSKIETTPKLATDSRTRAQKIKAVLRKALRGINEDD